MRRKIWALLVSGHAGDLTSLRRVLEQLVRISDAPSCQHAARYLAKPNPPHLVFTEATLPDGTWIDILKLAAAASRPVNVIVTSRTADIGLYIEAMEQGAFDFVTASSLIPEVAHVLRNAVANVLNRRQAQDRLCPESAPGSGKRKPLWWSRSV